VTAPESVHHDVGAYAIGVLDETASAEFEAHLAGCDACADELAGLLPVAGLLSAIDTGSLAESLGAPAPAGSAAPAGHDAPAGHAAPAGHDAPARRSAAAPAPAAAGAGAGAGGRFGEPRLRPAATGGGRPPTRREQRTGARSSDAGRRRRWSLTVAAAVVLLGLGAGVTTVVARADRAEHGRSVAAASRSAGDAGHSATPPPWDPSWPGLGDRGTPAGEHFATTDPGSGVHLEVYLDAKRWGTQLSVSVEHITGPLTCRLVVVSRDGSTEAVSSWGVPPEGYGTTAHPQPLVLPGSTRIARQDIARIDLVAAGGSGAGATVATLTP
jgi:hypothetical protein